MRFGVHLAGSGPFATPERIGQLAARAEALGFDSVWVSDHVIMPIEFSSVYPYGPPGTFTVESSRNYFEPIVSLAWVAGATRRVRLGTSILVIPLRNPVLAAKQLATLDALSGGRLVLGVGSGWFAEEFEALGQPYFRERGALTDEYIRIYRALWSGEPTEFEGEFYRFRSVQSLPRPAQSASGSGPPIWVGGHGERALRRTIEIGDAWAAIRIGIDDFRRCGQRLRELADGRGQPVPELTTRCNLGPHGPAPSPNDYELYGEPAAIAATLNRYAAAGCAEVIFDLFPRDSTDGMLETLERFTREIWPLVSRNPH
jgi:probable F420-dependent oxidoreductase